MVIGGLAGGLANGALSWLLLAEGIRHGQAARGLWAFELAVVKGAALGAILAASLGWTAAWLWERWHRAHRQFIYK